MASPFVWFDVIGSDRSATSRFLADTFGWQQNNIGSMTLQADGDHGPFAGICDAMDNVSGWIPYVEVDDLVDEARKAQSNGAVILAEQLDGPAGTATFIRDPGGSVMALWKRGAAA
ncbi:MAG: hypothetical protein NXI27_10655 [Alphaproteobacteria bacterium]|nr:hypothetical protein [Alphaproteobacteria bacterium]